MKDVLYSSGYQWDNQLDKIVNDKFKGNHTPSFVGYLDPKITQEKTSSVLVHNHIQRAQLASKIKTLRSSFASSRLSSDNGYSEYPSK